MGHDLLSSSEVAVNIFHFLWVTVEAGKTDFKVASCLPTCYYDTISR